jgi:disulfide bond formation protein DsbB
VEHQTRAILLERLNEMMSATCNWVLAVVNRPRRVWAGVLAAVVALLAFGLYLQHVVGLEPCPMCIVQRYAFLGVAALALVGVLSPQAGAQRVVAGLVFVLAGFGAFTAARQSWLQWFPPEVYSCGRDFYGMIENFPLKRAIPMIFRGSGDCTAIDWTFLGLSIANWSFLCFMAAMALAAGLLWQGRKASA